MSFHYHGFLGKVLPVLHLFVAVPILVSAEHRWEYFGVLAGIGLVDFLGQMLVHRFYSWASLIEGFRTVLITGAVGVAIALGESQVPIWLVLFVATMRAVAVFDDLLVRLLTIAMASSAVALGGYAGGIGVVNILALTFAVATAGLLVAALIIRMEGLHDRITEKDSRFRSMFDQASVAMARVDLDWKFLEINNEFRQLTGYDTIDLLALNFRDLQTPGTDDGYRDMLQATKPVQTIVPITRSDGSERWLDLCASFILDSNRIGTSIMLVAKDITQTKQLDDIVATQQQALVSASRMSELGLMSAGVAHEINNPISIINGLGQQLQRKLERGTLDPQRDVKIGIGRIVEASNRIHRIVRGLRSMARDAEHDPLVAERIEPIFQDVIEICSERIRSNGVRLLVEEPIPEVWTACRSAQLVQVLVNLLNNAFDAVVDDPDPWIRIAATTSETSIEIRVTDSGKGISEEIFQQILTPFYTTKAAGKGTGLGLSIAQKIIATHGGVLNIDRECANTCFVIRLPAVGVGGDERAA